MDVNKILAELRQEKGQLEDAIASLERLANGLNGLSSQAGPRKRGRPVGSKNKPKPDVVSTAAA